MKVRHVGSQVHQKLFKSARILSQEKIMKLGTPIESPLGDSKIKRFGGSGLVHACLDSSEEIDCPSSNIHNLGSFASIELIFVLIAAEFDGLSDELSARAWFAHLTLGLVCRLPSVSWLVLLVKLRCVAFQRATSGLHQTPLRAIADTAKSVHLRPS